MFLDPALWKELSEAAEFHTETFASLGAKETVSRNDFIEWLATWALGFYWEDKGGKPTGPEDRARKVKRHAERLKAEGARADASSVESSKTSQSK